MNAFFLGFFERCWLGSLFQQFAVSENAGVLSGPFPALGEASLIS